MQYFILITYLGYSFLVIFNFTALLALLSLPGWITIDEKYKKPLFYGVIIEVALFILSLATLEYLNKSQPQVEDNNWIALNLNDFSFIQPELKIVKPDTTILSILGKSYFDAENQLKANTLSGNYTNNGLSVLIQDSLYLGHMNHENLKKLKLFNSLKVDQEEKKLAHTRISFEKKGDSWITNHKFDKLPFEIKVRIGDHGTQYELWEDSAEIYNSVKTRDPETGRTSIYRTERENHIFETNHKYYLLYIQHADLDNGYIHFSLIELEPILTNL